MDLNTRREVRDYAKQILQTYTDAGDIESDELRDCLKRVNDGVVPPVPRVKVEEAALQTLLTFLEAQGTTEDVTARVQGQLASLRQASADGAATKAPSTLIRTKESTSTSSGTAATKGTFSLGALRAQMAKKREELKVTRSTTRATALVECDVPVTVAQKVTPSESADKVTSGTLRTAATDANTLRGAPPTTQSGAASTASLPRSTVVTNADEVASSGNRPDDATSLVGTAGTKRARPEVLLSACPIVEDDLYADLTLPPPRPADRENRWGSGEACNMSYTPVSASARRAINRAPDNAAAAYSLYGRGEPYRSYHVNAEPHIPAYYPY